MTHPTPAVLRPRRGGSRLRRLFEVAFAAFLGLTTVTSGDAHAQAGLGQGSAERPDSLAVGPVEISPATRAAADAEGRGVALARVQESLEERLSLALSQTRKFTMVTRARLDSILAEQSLAASGFINADDPNAARALKIAGVRWMAVPRIIDFEDITRTRRFEGIERTVERRTIRFSLAVQILDTTTGVVGETASVVVERTDSADENDRARPTGGDATNRLLDSMALEAADDIACRVLDAAYPASVLAVTNGLVTFNRGDGGCVETGQTWILTHRGGALVDPDTGETLGFDEQEIGAVEITTVGAKLARGRIIGGTAARGDVVRPAPEGWSPPTSFAVAASESTPSPSTAREDKSTEGVGRTSEQALAALGPVAVVVQGEVPGLPANATAALAANVGGAVSGIGLRAVDPADVVRAMRPGAADQAVEADASIARMAAAIGARSVLVIDLATVDQSLRRVEVGGNRTSMQETTLRGGWRLLDAGSGAAEAGDYFVVRVGSMASDGGGSAAVQIDESLAGRLYSDAAKTIAEQLKADAAALSGSTATAAGTGYLQVDAILDGLSVPEIIKNEDGEWRISGGVLPVLAGGAEIALDGFVICTTPCGVEVDRGPHRLTVTRTGAESWTREIRVLGGTAETPQRISVGLRLTDAERRRWLENAAIFEGLKEDAALTTAEVERINGFAQFLRQSGYRVDREERQDIKVDTDEAPVIERWNSYWNRW
ncbi:MAG: CsgG/HfaB family protein [Phycisphaerales bacterium]|jgi:hypothetical protein|nr:CsgG/HfaB family protein [Phycisphaerales bacterium]